VSRWFRLGGPESLTGRHPEELLAPQTAAFGVTLARPLWRPVQIRLVGDLGWGWERRRAMRLDEMRGGFGAGLHIDLPLGSLEVLYGHAAGGHDLWTASLGYPLRAGR
jgi:hemolysin activation/secretion protein